MRTLKLVFALIMPLTFMACSTTKETSNNKSEGNIEKIQIIESGEMDSSTDPYTVQNMTIEDDILAIEVCYGGCAEHDWKLITTSIYKKSLPPQLDIHLSHNQHDDLCKRQECDTLYFDISDIKYPGKPENYAITLNLNNTNKSVNYEY